MPFRAEHIGHFKTLASLRPPRVLVAIGWMLAIGIALGAVLLAVVPWLQTAPGAGQVAALNPDDRVQAITALVPGRVERWYVQDGQRVRRGDPIARIVDNDPDLLTRLRAERSQVLAEIAAAEQALAVARIDVDRSRELLGEGLIARRDLEARQIGVAERQARIADARAKLTRVDISLNRQSVQTVHAPRDGRVQQINAAAGATLVSAGQLLATLAPEAPVRIVELMIDGRDVPLVRPGQPVRLEFEGWPAIQFSGWPSIAQGMFDGRVRAIDPAPQPTGLFRVLVEPRPGAPAWPDQNFARLGAKVRGWIQMETVSVGYELWRQLNDFPLEFRRPADDESAASAGAGSADRAPPK